MGDQCRHWFGGRTTLLLTDEGLRCEICKKVIPTFPVSIKVKPYMKPANYPPAHQEWTDKDSGLRMTLDQYTDDDEAMGVQKPDWVKTMEGPTIKPQATKRWWQFWK